MSYFSCSRCGRFGVQSVDSGGISLCPQCKIEVKTQRIFPEFTTRKPCAIAIPRTVIPAFARVNVTLSPLVQFKGEGIRLYGVCVNVIDVFDIRVGERSQFATIGAIPASWFRSHNRVVQFDTAMPGQEIVFGFENTGTKAAMVRGVVWGTATFT